MSATLNPVQLRLDASDRQIPAGRPLVHPKALETLLDREPHDIEFLVDSGALEYAFDLSTAGSGRREKRVWRQSVIEYAAGYLGRNDLNRKADRMPEVLRACLPPGNGPFALSHLKRRWTVSSTHLHALLADGVFLKEPGQALTRKQSPLLQRASVAAFLARRRIAV